MSFGFAVYNNNDDAVISDTTYNMVYIGRATFSSYQNPHPSYYIETRNFLGVTTPLVYQYTFTFTAPNSKPVVPFFSGGGFCALMVSTRSGNSCTFIFEAESQPTVYCFSQLDSNTSLVGAGYGFAVFNKQGGVSFLSTKPHIVPKYADNVTSKAEDWLYASGGGGNYRVWYPTNQSQSNAIGSSMVTPIMYYATPNMSVKTETQLGSFYATLCAKVVGSTVVTAYCCSGEISALLGGINNILGAQSAVAIVAEGQYFS